MKTLSCLLSFALLAVLGSATAQIDTVTGDGVDPSMGSLGTTLTITGAGFGGPTGLGKPSAFLLDPMTLKKFTLKLLTFSDTEVTAQITKAAYGALDVNVQPKGGPLLVAAGAFTVPDPEITGVLPMDESGTIGTTVTISGSGLLGVVGLSKPKVQLFDPDTGKKYALKVATFSDTEVTASITKAVAGTMELQLLPKGGAALIATAGFEVPLPNILSITPAFGFANDTITLECEHVGNKKPKVKLGTKSCKVLSFSDTEVAFLMPKKLAKGAQTLQLTNKVGVATQIAAIINQGDGPDTVTDDAFTATLGKTKFVAGGFIFFVVSSDYDPMQVDTNSMCYFTDPLTFQEIAGMVVHTPFDPHAFTEPVAFVDAPGGSIGYKLIDPNADPVFGLPLGRWSSDAVGGSSIITALGVEELGGNTVRMRLAFSGTMVLVEGTGPETIVVTNGFFRSTFDALP